MLAPDVEAAHEAAGLLDDAVADFERRAGLDDGDVAARVELPRRKRAIEDADAVDHPRGVLVGDDLVVDQEVDDVARAREDRLVEVVDEADLLDAVDVADELLGRAVAADEHADDLPRGEGAARAGDHVVELQGAVEAVEAGIGQAVLELDEVDPRGAVQPREAVDPEHHLDRVVVVGGQRARQLQSLAGAEGVVGGVKSAAVVGEGRAAERVVETAVELVTVHEALHAAVDDAGNALDAERGVVLGEQHAGLDVHVAGVGARRLDNEPARAELGDAAGRSAGVGGVAGQGELARFLAGSGRSQLFDAEAALAVELDDAAQGVVPGDVLDCAGVIDEAEVVVEARAGDHEVVDHVEFLALPPGRPRPRAGR